MNKKIKRIIGCSIAIATIATIEPAKYINLMSTEAYASSSDKAYLSDIDVSKGSLSFSKSKTSYNVRVGSSVNELRIDVNADNDYDVTIDGYDGTSKTVDLDKGSNRIRIRVKDRTGNKDTVTYTLNINRGSRHDYDDDHDRYDDDDDIYLDDITVNEGSINFSRKRSSYIVNVDSSVSEIKIKAKPQYSRDEVRINGSLVDDDDNYKTTVSLNNGTNTIEITVEDDDNDNQRLYTLYVNRGTATSSSSGKEDTKQDSIYLDKLYVDSGSIPIAFTRRVTSYTANVKKDCNEVIIKAEPEDHGDVVRVNGDKVDRDYKKIVKLNEGKNEIKVRVSNEDDDFEDKRDYKDNFEERTYTITIYRGDNSNTDTNTNTKIDQWTNVTGRWQYNNSMGNALKNTWYYDRNYGKTYYLDYEGYMKTGWLSNNGCWYYLDESGARQTGWKQIGSNWYYLDSTGKMQTGWFKDINGAWYYLYSSGAMAANTTVGGYKLGINGALI